VTRRLPVGVFTHASYFELLFGTPQFLPYRDGGGNFFKVNVLLLIIFNSF